MNIVFEQKTNDDRNTIDLNDVIFVILNDFLLLLIR